MTLATETRVREAIRTRRSLPAPSECQRLRESAGLSQRELAGLIGVSPSAVRLWENGQRRPTGRRLVAYLAALKAMGEA